MNNINLKGIDASSVGRLIITLIALMNVILPMFGFNPLNIDDSAIYETISAIFVLGMTIYSSYKNFNVTNGAQKLQTVLDMVNQGEIVVDDIDAIVSKLKIEKQMTE